MNGQTNSTIVNVTFLSVYSLASTSIVQNTWNLGNPLQIHGLVYDSKTGLLDDLQISADNPGLIDAVYRLEPAEVIATS